MLHILHSSYCLLMECPITHFTFIILLIDGVSYYTILHSWYLLFLNTSSIKACCYFTLCHANFAMLVLTSNKIGSDLNQSMFKPVTVLIYSTRAGFRELK